jgi:hypothetical protein
MNAQPSPKPPEPPPRYREYEDCHYHNDVEVVLPEDTELKPVQRRRPPYKLPKHRSFDDD